MADRLILADALIRRGEEVTMGDVFPDWLNLPEVAKEAACTHGAYFRKLVESTPTVDAVEVVHGEWSTIEDDYTGLVALQCSVCNQEYWFEDEPPIKIYNYCPNCGAKMDGERKDND